MATEVGALKSSTKERSPRPVGPSGDQFVTVQTGAAGKISLYGLELERRFETWFSICSIQSTNDVDYRNAVVVCPHILSLNL
jgi:hypothetical protein